MMPSFYDGSALLSKRDLDGLQPDIYMCVGNRSAGKTYFFSRHLLRRYINRGEVFCVLDRYVQQCREHAITFGQDVLRADRICSGHVLKSKAFGSVGYCLYMDDNPAPCGYVLALNNSETIRRNSSGLQDIQTIFFDEFMSENSDYLSRETQRLQSVHTSIARGGGAQARRVPVILCANCVSKINPYFVAFGIHKRLDTNTNFLRGRGWVLEQTYNASAAEARAASGFARAFANSDYSEFSNNNAFLLDDSNFIKKMSIDGNQLFCLDSSAGVYGVWRLSGGRLYVSPRHASSGWHFATARTQQTSDNLAGSHYGRATILDAYNSSRLWFADSAAYAATMEIFDNYDG
jgi:hypothetical protein